MKYEEPTMNIIYLEESVITMSNQGSGTGGSGSWTDTYNLLIEDNLNNM